MFWLILNKTKWHIQHKRLSAAFLITKNRPLIDLNLK
ncbi:hypothetical protein J543_4030, partial [Acinetobacter baumannii 1159076]